MRLLSGGFLFFVFAALAATAPSAFAQEDLLSLDELRVPGLNEYAPPRQNDPLALAETGEVTLSALLSEESEEIPGGLVWRIFAPEPGADGTLPLVATAKGGTSTFMLPPGGYLVHAAYGRAGATKRITVGPEPKTEQLVLDAGGLKLDAVLPGGIRIPPQRLRFSIYESEPDATGERPLIIPDVQPDSVVRLNAGTYHVVSTYGSVNAVIRADIRVEAGELTEATVEHRAAPVTLKLVREPGGEAIADTAWSILAGTGEMVREMVGAYASMVLAEGEYTVVAKNRDRIYRRDFTVVPGRRQDVELLPDDLVDPDEEIITD
ncbi:hypothetical protein [Chelativorans intermedius]|uniref:Uncharacterized protein n=1 Tax=Chelativorans intermedius TaxID=515947 RepID=A0ABV6D560_9HYPH|nr:hypothetical protein [Chelativorans intermedius]MCT8997179.1 hypothetical protein [Chelativorans intermedius]